ncbi:hypothetical protein KIPB_002221, partial [Kipferlia bialata]
AMADDSSDDSLLGLVTANLNIPKEAPKKKKTPSVSRLDAAVEQRSSTVLRAKGRAKAKGQRDKGAARVQRRSARLARLSETDDSSDLSIERETKGKSASTLSVSLSDIGAKQAPTTSSSDSIMEMARPTSTRKAKGKRAALFPTLSTASPDAKKKERERKQQEAAKERERKAAVRAERLAKAEAIRARKKAEKEQRAERAREREAQRQREKEREKEKVPSDDEVSFSLSDLLTVKVSAAGTGSPSPSHSSSVSSRSQSLSDSVSPSVPPDEAERERERQREEADRATAAAIAAASRPPPRRSSRIDKARARASRPPSPEAESYSYYSTSTESDRPPTAREIRAQQREEQRERERSGLPPVKRDRSVPEAESKPPSKASSPVVPKDAPKGKGKGKAPSPVQAKRETERERPVQAAKRRPPARKRGKDVEETVAPSSPIVPPAMARRVAKARAERERERERERAKQKVRTRDMGIGTKPAETKHVSSVAVPLGVDRERYYRMVAEDMALPHSLALSLSQHVTPLGQRARKDKCPVSKFQLGVWRLQKEQIMHSLENRLALLSPSLVHLAKATLCPGLISAHSDLLGYAPPLHQLAGHGGNELTNALSTLETHGIEMLGGARVGRQPLPEGPTEGDVYRLGLLILALVTHLRVGQAAEEEAQREIEREIEADSETGDEANESVPVSPWQAVLEKSGPLLDRVSPLVTSLHQRHQRQKRYTTLASGVSTPNESDSGSVPTPMSTLHALADLGVWVSRYPGSLLCQESVLGSLDLYPHYPASRLNPKTERVGEREGESTQREALEFSLLFSKVETAKVAEKQRERERRLEAEAKVQKSGMPIFGQEESDSLTSEVERPTKTCDAPAAKAPVSTSNPSTMEVEVDREGEREAEAEAEEEAGSESSVSQPVPKALGVEMEGEAEREREAEKEVEAEEEVQMETTPVAVGEAERQTEREPEGERHLRRFFSLPPSLVSCLTSWVSVTYPSLPTPEAHSLAKALEERFGRLHTPEPTLSEEGREAILQEVESVALRQDAEAVEDREKLEALRVELTSAEEEEREGLKEIQERQAERERERERKQKEKEERERESDAVKAEGNPGVVVAIEGEKREGEGEKVETPAATETSAIAAPDVPAVPEVDSETEAEVEREKEREREMAVKTARLKAQVSVRQTLLSSGPSLQQRVATLPLPPSGSLLSLSHMSERALLTETLAKLEPVLVPVSQETDWLGLTTALQRLSQPHAKAIPAPRAIFGKVMRGRGRVGEAEVIARQAVLYRYGCRLHPSSALSTYILCLSGKQGWKKLVARFGSQALTQTHLQQFYNWIMQYPAAIMVIATWEILDSASESVKKGMTLTAMQEAHSERSASKPSSPTKGSPGTDQDGDVSMGGEVKPRPRGRPRKVPPPPQAQQSADGWWTQVQKPTPVDADKDADKDTDKEGEKDGETPNTPKPAAEAEAEGETDSDNKEREKQTEERVVTIEKDRGCAFSEPLSHLYHPMEIVRLCRARETPRWRDAQGLTDPLSTLDRQLERERQGERVYRTWAWLSDKSLRRELEMHSPFCRVVKSRILPPVPMSLPLSFVKGERDGGEEREEQEEGQSGWERERERETARLQELERRRERQPVARLPASLAYLKHRLTLLAPILWPACRVIGDTTLLHGYIALGLDAQRLASGDTYQAKDKGAKLSLDEKAIRRACDLTQLLAHSHSPTFATAPFAAVVCRCLALGAMALPAGVSALRPPSDSILAHYAYARDLLQTACLLPSTDDEGERERASDIREMHTTLTLFNKCLRIAHLVAQYPILLVAYTPNPFRGGETKGIRATPSYVYKCLSSLVSNRFRESAPETPAAEWERERDRERERQRLWKEPVADRMGREKDRERETAREIQAQTKRESERCVLWRRWSFLEDFDGSKLPEFCSPTPTQAATLARLYKRADRDRERERERHVAQSKAEGEREDGLITGRTLELRDLSPLVMHGQDRERERDLYPERQTGRLGEGEGDVLSNMQSVFGSCLGVEVELRRRVAQLVPIAHALDDMLGLVFFVPLVTRHYGTAPVPVMLSQPIEACMGVGGEGETGSGDVAMDGGEGERESKGSERVNPTARLLAMYLRGSLCVSHFEGGSVPLAWTVPEGGNQDTVPDPKNGAACIAHGMKELAPSFIEGVQRRFRTPDTYMYTMVHALMEHSLSMQPDDGLAPYLSTFYSETEGEGETDTETETERESRRMDSLHLSAFIAKHPLILVCRQRQ